MNMTTRSSALLLCLGCAWGACAPAAEPGWYVVGFGGESSAAGLGRSQMDENMTAIFESVGLEVVDATSTLDDSDTGFGVAGGNQFNDYFAVEFAFVDLGAVDYHAAVTVTNGVDQTDAEMGLETSASGPVLSVLGVLPIGERFSVFGRAGLSLLSADGKARITLDGITQRASETSEKTDPVLGVGAEFTLSRNFAIRLAWDRYFDVGTEDVTGDIDADLISLGLRMNLAWFR